MDGLTMYVGFGYGLRKLMQREYGATRRRNGRLNTNHFNVISLHAEGFAAILAAAADSSTRTSLLRKQYY